MNRQSLMLIVVAALGYFVDIYDLILFNVVKKESLEDILAGASPATIKDTGMFLFNMQMLGMLVGGILWGIWGDKRGRISVLFGSILLYSIANVANAFVTNVQAYSLIRFIAGLGLAGELGAGITLVSETMHREKRGIGTMIIVTFGALGAVVAGLVGTEGHYIGNWLESWTTMSFPNWKVAYLVGGALGLVLLILRIGAFESGMFQSIRHEKVRKGDFMMLFTDPVRRLKYLRCILIGVPIWYFIGLIIANSQEIFAKELETSVPVKNALAVIFAYIGLSSGDLVSGLLSQWLRSRRKVVIIYLLMSVVVMTWFLYFSKGINDRTFYFMTFLIGFATGYWAIFVTIASEQFGTNIRSTVTNTVPNFVRGSVPIITGLFGFLTTYLGDINSAFGIGLLCIGLALWSVIGIPESFSKDLNYVEGVPVEEAQLS